MNKVLSAIILQPAVSDTDFKEIIELQRENHYKSLNAQQQQEQGFVFAEHTIGMLKLMSAKIPQLVALHEGRVIGYNLAMTATMETDLQSLEPMFREFHKTLYKGRVLTDYNFFVGGQVCVANDFRGLGLLNKLYHATADAVNGIYDLCVTEISFINNHSLKAHQKMGFEIAGSHIDDFGGWYVVVWDLRA
ncbi:GNAT family N-acetyltransferase [Mucilaginibacter glaciei]|uniref:GNAT family N-acetyltransferase n=1 Tax=Mucilaginibacter glaciei TaxID=2772109 RepID=A0A926S4Z8_9SPHI|nr:GNAT family N-acetyltransferase [Mucilaginibacter glaciei]MBD1392246.1 GNAT family N-acetyltransferase [Mucilaginibacter glaciei]